MLLAATLLLLAIGGPGPPPSAHGLVINGSVGSCSCDSNTTHLTCTGLGITIATLPPSLAECPNVVNIKLDKNNLTECPSAMLQSLPGLGILSLAHNNIREIKSGALSGLSGLRSVSLNNNEITAVDTDVFGDAPLLGGLDLSANFISRLPDDFLFNMSMLIDLQMDHNIISSVQWNFFSKNPILSTIALNNNQLSWLNESLFANNAQLNTIFLFNNLFQSLPAAIFQPIASNAAILDISHNQITSLDAGIFNGMVSITNLNIGNNNITFLPAGIFAQLTSMLELSIAYNPLRNNFPSSIFQNLTSLQLLLMTNLQLPALDPDFSAGLFAGLESLQALSLESNGLTALTAAMFGNLTQQLQTLSVVNNNITLVEAAVFGSLLFGTALGQTAPLVLSMEGNPSHCETGWQVSRQIMTVFCSCAAGLVGTVGPGQTLASGCHDRTQVAADMVALPALVTSTDVVVSVPVAKEQVVVNATCQFPPGASPCCTASILDAANGTMNISTMPFNLGTPCLIAPGLTVLFEGCDSIVFNTLSDYYANVVYGTPNTLPTPAAQQLRFTRGQQASASLLKQFPTNPQFAASLSFSIAPPLPDGLLLDPATGAIAGTPAASQRPTQYALTQTTSIGTSSASACSLVSVQISLRIRSCDSRTCNGGICVCNSAAETPDYPGECFGAFHCTCPESQVGFYCEDANPFLRRRDLLNPGGNSAFAILTVATLMLAVAMYFFFSRNVYGRVMAFLRLRQANTDLLQKLLASEEEMVTMRRIWQIDESELRMDKEIARGAFGIVYKAVWNEIPVAVKMLARPVQYLEREDAEEFDREVSFMRAVRHPNIVLFFGAGATKDGLPFLVTEFMERGSLRVVLENSPDIAWTQKQRFAHDTALGMQHLHSLGSIHRDLKSGNLLVTKGFRIKVADFGTARLASVTTTGARSGAGAAPVATRGNSAADSGGDSRTLTTLVGTSLWMAPEVLFKQPYSQKADVYSFGIVLFEILTQTTPWNELPTKFMVNHLDAALREGKRPAVPATHHCGAGYRELMERCWAQRPEDRPAFDEVAKDSALATSAEPPAAAAAT